MFELVYHDGSSNTTFQQRYQLDVSYFKPGGPILLLQGAEIIPGLEAEPIDEFDFYDDTIELNGIAAGIEHRFFGTSFPPGFDGSKASYAPLTLENVLTDTVALVELIRANVSGAEHSPVFVQSVLPVLSEMLMVVPMSNAYYDISSAAATKIKSAMRSFEECSASGNCNTTLDLGLCDPQPNATGYQNMYGAVLDLYKRIPQFSYPIGANLPANAFQQLINLTEAANTTSEVLRAPIQVANWAMANLSQCVNYTTGNATGGLEAARSGSFGWVQCNYFMTNQYSIGANNMLPPNDASGRVEICEIPEWAGPRVNWTNEEWIQWYGFSNEQLSQEQRMVFIGGQQDPIAGISLPDLPESPDRQAPRSIVAPGGAHTGDMMGQMIAPKGLSVNLDTIRNTKLQYLKDWVQSYHMNESNSTSTELGRKDKLYFELFAWVDDFRAAPKFN
ncbi:uncharacterized protein LY89DRAFT_766264 [Mollisia scopiformis]|uniref:Peptidase S33 tripeptidyl aminopeptidase-like C-terminal domain-containing protein n=1 Tax=Mollisia scopiformis TaxID=149040 RepID=A0A132B6T6_MOLSC|nr:uncharacterized protein LY89DRAFT_766264 [Mollisia scopiformis]KUJ07594.1 hypothetical protein LY89DRAFT_766264 [Mollisia scopiformis]